MENNSVDKKSPIKIKIITLGNAEVGKSCIIKRYCEKRFVSKYLTTIGIDYGVIKVPCKERQMRVNIFDMAGHPSFYEVRNEFYADTHGVLLVYDVGDAESLSDLDVWLEEMKEEIKNNKSKNNSVFIVCANKIPDSRIEGLIKAKAKTLSKQIVDKRRVVDEADGLLWADSHGFKHFDVSAKTGEGIAEVFQCLFESILEVMDNGGIRQDQRPGLNYTKDQREIIQRLKSAQDDHARLGLKPDATIDDVNKSFRRLSVLLHPDKSLAPGTEEAFKILVAARTNVINSLSR